MDTPFLLRWKNPPDLSTEELLEFSEINDPLQIERECDGSLLIMSPTGLTTGDRNADLTMQLRLWAKRDGSGVAADSSVGYELPNRSLRGPDASWTRRERIEALPPGERNTIPHLVPDFVVELRSTSNRLRRLREKMDEYMANGVRLGWLLDPTSRTAYVYRPGAEVQVFENASSLDASPELPGFVLDLVPIWS